jgi:hypothetical protein
MTTGAYLTEEDKRLVEEFLKSVSSAKRDRKRPTPKVEQQMSPEIYVACSIDRKPIPRRQGNKPGKATVRVYRIVEQPTSTSVHSGMFEIEPVMLNNGRQKEVEGFNMDTQPLEWDYYDLRRDKYGRWLLSCCQ